MNAVRKIVAAAGLLAVVGMIMLATDATAQGPVVPPIDNGLAHLWIEASSDRCIQLEQQFDSVKDKHASSLSLHEAMSYREKGAYLCNADVDDKGEELLERALRSLGEEPDPIP